MKIFKGLLVCFTAVMFVLFVQVSAFADVNAAALEDSDITIDEDGTVVEISSVTTDNSIIIDGAKGVKITLKGVNITAYDSPAIELKNGAEVTLIVNGDNTLKGGKGTQSIGGVEYEIGFAGICVPREWDNDDNEIVSKLTIEGDGLLNSTGGDAYVAGAGIGSNGLGDLGEIVIGEDFDGEINATGGSQRNTNGNDGGGGAGIGGGGTYGFYDDDWNPLWEWYGKITINGGTIKSVGKDGGAGIGTGGNSQDTSTNHIVINIKGGNVTALGEKSPDFGGGGAGIGGGAGSYSGKIIIEGGKINAKGQDGGAGIGAGKNYPCNDIAISGGYITAVGEYGAAGIGGGYGDGVDGSISISGDAKIIAFGGNLNSGSAGRYIGGAGIGTGCCMSAYYGAKINITEEAEVYAYSGGYGANAIGLGTPFRVSLNAKEEDLKTNITFGKDICILASVPDMSAAAVPVDDITPIKGGDSVKVKTEVEEPAMLVYYTKAEGDEYPEKEFESDTTSSDSFKWKRTESDLIVDDKTFSWHSEYMNDEDYAPGNWAVLYKVAEKFTVEFDSKGGSMVESQTVADGEKAAEPEKPTKDGYTFKGWYSDEDLTEKWNFENDTVTSDIILYAKWEKNKDKENNGGGSSYELPEKKQDKTPADKYPDLITDDHFAYMVGYPDNTFLPDRSMTRAEVAVMFSRLITEKINEDMVYVPSFLDVTADKWYYNQIGFMEEFGIITGYPDGTFKPDAPITRAEFATIAAKFDKLNEVSEIIFADVDSGHWAYRFIAQAYNRGWVSGYPDGMFYPDQYITRAEVVSVINRMLDRIGDKYFLDIHKLQITDFTDIDNSYWAYYDILEAANGHYYQKNPDESWTELKK